MNESTSSQNSTAQTKGNTQVYTQKRGNDTVKCCTSLQSESVSRTQRYATGIKAIETQHIRDFMALRRLQYEYKKFVQEPQDALIRAGPIDEEDLYRWWATIVGPEGTPYQGGIFRILIEYSTEYPFKPPKMRFDTRIFHPNISRRGTVCVDILQKQWSPALTTAKVLLSICSLLASPNPNDPMDAESATLYVDNRAAYEHKARLWTEMYAKESDAAAYGYTAAPVTNKYPPQEMQHHSGGQMTT